MVEISVTDDHLHLEVKGLDSYLIVMRCQC